MNSTRELQTNMFQFPLSYVLKLFDWITSRLKPSGGLQDHLDLTLPNPSNTFRRSCSQGCSIQLPEVSLCLNNTKDRREEYYMGTQMNSWGYASLPCGCLYIKLLSHTSCLMPRTHHPAFSAWVPVWLLLQSNCSSDQRHISLAVDCLQTPDPLVMAALPVSQTLLQPQRWKHQPDCGTQKVPLHQTFLSNSVQTYTAWDTTG